VWLLAETVRLVIRGVLAAIALFCMVSDFCAPPFIFDLVHCLFVRSLRGVLAWLVRTISMVFPNRVPCNLLGRRSLCRWSTFSSFVDAVDLQKGSEAIFECTGDAQVALKGQHANRILSVEC
jgi:hypothetical protein